MEGPTVNWALESKSRMQLFDFEHWRMWFAHWACTFKQGCNATNWDIISMLFSTHCL